MKNRSQLFKFTCVLCCTFFLTGLQAQNTLSTIRSFIRKDTTISHGTGTWNVSFYVDSRYYGQTGADSTQMIIFFPGLGESGDGFPGLKKFGPLDYLDAGWDGGVTLGNGTHYPILVAVEQISAFPCNVAPRISAVIQQLTSRFRVKSKNGRKCVHLTGLSAGGYTAKIAVMSDPYSTTGPWPNASAVMSVTDVQGVLPNCQAAVSDDYSKWIENFARSGGRMVSFEGSSDGRDHQTVINRMNATVANSGVYYRLTSAEGMATHCCWQRLYGGNGSTTTGGNPPMALTFDGKTQTIYQWMLRQGDTTLVNNTPADNLPMVYVLSAKSGGDIYIPDASSRGWKGGDTLRIMAGTYTTINLGKFQGDATKPITIINYGGQVKAARIIIDKAAYFKLTGTGSPAIAYGFKIASSQNTGVGIGLAHHVEVSNIEVSGTESGFLFKKNPTGTDALTIAPNYTLSNYYIHHNYIHNIKGEGMYIGHTAPDGDPDNNNLKPVRMDKVEIAYNIVDSTGWDGIQLSNARSGAKIHHNTITNFGRSNQLWQQAGIILGGNTTGDIYDNVVKNGTGNGIQAFGYGAIRIYNNTIENTGVNGTTDGVESVFANDLIIATESNAKQQILFNNNTIKYPKPYGALRIGAYNNNSNPAQVTINEYCIANTPTNWVQKYIIANPSGSVIDDNTLLPNCASLLPVKLINFQASKVANGVSLTWEVEQDEDLKNFQVEKSENGRDFVLLATINPYGKAGYASYKHFDNSGNTSSKVYYRLQVVLQNGSSIYSRVIVVKNNTGAPELIIKNNTSSVAISFSNNEGGPAAGKLSIVNSVGQVVKMQPIPIAKGVNLQQLDVMNLPHGIYQVVVSNKNQLIVGRFIRH